MLLVKPNDSQTQLQLQHLTQTASAQPRVANFLGWYFLAQEDWGRASRFFSQAQQSSKQHVMAKLGGVLATLGAGAVDDATRRGVEQKVADVFALPAGQLSEAELAMAHFVRAQSAHLSNDGARAAAELAAATTAEPNNRLFGYYQGVSLLKAGKAKEAAAIFAKQWAERPTVDNMRLGKKLLDATLSAHLYPEAAAMLGQASKLWPNDPELQLYQGRLHQGQHESAAALKSYQQLLRDDQSPYVAAAQIGMSQLLCEGGHAAQAVAQLEKFTAEMPETTPPDMVGRVWCALGQAYEAAHNKAKAASSF